MDIYELLITLLFKLLLIAIGKVDVLSIGTSLFPSPIAIVWILWPSNILVTNFLSLGIRLYAIKLLDFIASYCTSNHKKF